MALRVKLVTERKSPQATLLDLDFFGEEQRFLSRRGLITEQGPAYTDELFAAPAPSSLSDELRARRHPEDLPPLAGAAAETMRGEIARTGAATDTEVEEVESYTLARFLNPSLPALDTDFYDRLRQEEEDEVPPQRTSADLRKNFRVRGERPTQETRSRLYEGTALPRAAFASEPPPGPGIRAIGPGLARGIQLGPSQIPTGVEIPSLGVFFPLEQELRRRSR